MLRSSYSELEEAAQKGTVLVVTASLLHLAGSAFSLAAMGASTLSMVWSMLIQIVFCGCLYLGQRWARWALAIFNGLAIVFTVTMLGSGTVVPMVMLGRAALCLAIIVLLFLPPVRSFLTWKNMRF